jgi:hypothetical protein
MEQHETIGLLEERTRKEITTMETTFKLTTKQIETMTLPELCLHRDLMQSLAAKYAPRSPLGKAVRIELRATKEAVYAMIAKNTKEVA